MGRENHQYLPLTEGLMDAIREGDATDNQWYRIRDRIQHNLKNGWVIWNGVGPSHHKKIFNVFDPDFGDQVDAMGEFPGLVVFEQEELDEARRLRQGLVGWLAFLYQGIEDAESIHRPIMYAAAEDEDAAIDPDGTGERVIPSLPKEVSLEFDPEEGLVAEREPEPPDIHFDFEVILQEAVDKVARQRGKRVTNVTIETEPIQRRTFDTEDLKNRFKNRDPGLSMLELRHLREAGEIGADEEEAYQKDVSRKLDLGS